MQPQLTPTLGIMFGPKRKLKYAEQLSEEMQLTNELIELMPRCPFSASISTMNFQLAAPVLGRVQQTTRYIRNRRPIKPRPGLGKHPVQHQEKD